MMRERERKGGGGGGEGKEERVSGEMTKRIGLRNYLLFKIVWESLCFKEFVDIVFFCGCINAVKRC